MKFTYKILVVEPQFNVMQVSYESKGYPTLLIGMPLLVKGDILEDKILQYAPIQQWKTLDKEFLEVRVGHIGEIEYIDPISTTDIIEQPDTSLESF